MDPRWIDYCAGDLKANCLDAGEMNPVWSLPANVPHFTRAIAVVVDIDLRHITRQRKSAPSGLERRLGKEIILRRLLTSTLVLIAISVGIIGVMRLRGNPDALRAIVERRCLPADLAGTAEPLPCILVDRRNDYVALKDQKGSRHYLLLPISHITGIESPVLLAQSAPNFFEFAWKSRGLLSTGRTKQIADDEVLLAVNSETGRTQNQLHIHISSIKPAIRDRLREIQTAISEQWAPVTGDLAGHSYWARRVSLSEFEATGPFRLLASGLPNAGNAMGRFSLAVIKSPPDFVLLATERNLLALNLASAEELQDEGCGDSN